MRAVLHRFPNVVLWLNGHRHRNAVEFRRSPVREDEGFFEVSTAALADWPSQARLVELTANDNGTLSILCTMLDHAGHADPRLDDGLGRLAALHREPPPTCQVADSAPAPKAALRTATSSS